MPDIAVPEMDLLDKWINVSTQLKALREEETKIRRYLCEALFLGRLGEESAKFETTDYKFEAKNVVSRSVDSGVLQAIMDELSETEKACISYTPKLALRKYRKLSNDSLLQEAVIEKPGMPQLKFTEKEPQQ